MKTVTIFVIDPDLGYIQYEEKDHPSLTISVKDGCLIITDFEGILDVIPLKNITRCKRR